MPVTETVDTSTDPVPNTDLPNPENSLNQENISLYGHLFLAALSEGEDIKKALNPEEKLDLGTVDAMRGKRLATAEVERKYNPVINGFSVHERTEKWKGKSFQEAYSQWSSNLLNSVNQSPSQERKNLISKFFGKDLSEVKDEDIKVLYDQYCRGGSNVDDFIKKAVEGESSGTEVEWLAKKLFGTKSGETVRRIYEIEADIKKAGSIDNALRKANEMFWQSGLDRFNNPNKDEEDLLGLLFTHFRETQKENAPTNDESKDSTETPNTNSPENPEQDGDNEGAPTAPRTEESSETPTDIPTPPENPEPNTAISVDASLDSDPKDSIMQETPETDEGNNGAPPPTGEAEKETPDESPNSITEAEAVESTQTPEPSIQPAIIEPDKTTEPPSTGGSLNDTPGESSQPDAVEPTPEPTGGTWPPAEVEPIGNPAGSIWQRIKGKFSR